MKPTVNLYKLGRLSYIKALNIQQLLFNNLKSQLELEHDNIYNNNFKHKKFNLDDGDATDSSLNLVNKKSLLSGTRNSLILVEHEPVYTIGIRSKSYNENYVSELMKKLAAKNLKADFVRSNRGGLITFHGPGQLVAYPVIYLGDFTKTIHNRSVKAYVKLLEITIIDTLNRIGIRNAHTVREYPGVWLNGGESKIAFIGIACKRYITMHGISINCDCDLTWFDMIVSCGIEEKQITSISQELNLNRPSINRVTSKVQSFYVNGESSIECDGNNGALSSSNFDTTSLSSIDSISRAFCSSFSQNFECQIKVEPPNLTTNL